LAVMKMDDYKISEKLPRRGGGFNVQDY
jgi:hypothetical protein